MIKNMSNSSNICVHIVFSTRHRLPLIPRDQEHKIHAYLGGLCNGLNCTPICIGGHLDHVHILCLLSKNISMAELLEKLKRNSSRWIKTLGPEFRDFYWQKGFGAFSADYRKMDNLIHYINHQYEHHSRRSYQDELMSMCREYEVEYDEAQLWD